MRTKASNLHKLLHLGFNVPPGFCITSEVYHEHIEKSGIKKCWASLWNERVFHYREKYKINHREISMAAIVQTLIEPDFSGVLFTVDPAKGEKNRIVMEYCRGQREALVYGRGWNSLPYLL